MAPHPAPSAGAGESITAWVNPQAPAQALLDRSIRWRLQIFRLPFALVFTGVGVTAALVVSAHSGGALRRCTSRPEPTHSLAKGQGVLWFFAVLPGVASLSPWPPCSGRGRQRPWWVKGFMGIFVVIGVGLVAVAWQNSRKAWRYQGVGMAALPSRPTAGRSSVPTPVPAARLCSKPGLKLRLQVAQYRVDESSPARPSARWRC